MCRVSAREELEGTQWDVVVSGLGPVGVTLCSLLGKFGLRTLGVDREKSIYTLPRAGHVDHTVLRTLGEIGCLDEVLAEMIPNHGMELLGREGDVLARIPVAQRTPSGLPASMHFHQPVLERLLRENAERIEPITLRNSVCVTSFKSRDGIQEVELESNGERFTVCARFLVGCDGASSLIRNQAGLGFRDYGFAESWMVVDLILRSFPETLRRDTTFVADPRRPHAMIEMPGMRYRFEFMMLPGETPETLTKRDNVMQLISHWLTPQQIHKVERAIVYTFRGAQAVKWRDGNVAVAGDAAHLTPPMLGQGLCSGVRDAANLAWKIAYYLDGRMPESVLDTYGEERGPHVDNVISTSILVAKNLCMLDEEGARKRDEELQESGEPAESRIRFKLGELRPGPLVMPSGGMYMVNLQIGEQTLDDLVGRDFLVLGLDEEALGSKETQNWWRKLGAELRTVSSLGGKGDELLSWFSRRDGRVVVIRPDKYVLGCENNLDRITDYVCTHMSMQ